MDNVKVEMSSMTTLDTRVAQVTNVAPAATLDQMTTLFGFLGKIEEIKLYPSDDYPIQPSSRICYVKYDESWSVGVAQHLTNTVFIDRALIVVPVVDGHIPDESQAMSLAAANVPGILGSGPSHLINQVTALAGAQVVTTVDPALTALGLPQYPPLPANTDPTKIEEIRRTIYVGNLGSAVTAEHLLKFFNHIGEVKYVRMAGDENQPTRFAFVEFTEQSSLTKALQYNGFLFSGRPLKVNHSNNAIVKPQTKSSEAAQREIEEAMKRVREAQSLITAAIEPGIVGDIFSIEITDPDKKKERSKSRSRSRHRSRSRSHKRSRSRSRSRKHSRSPRRSTSHISSKSRRRSRSKSHRKSPTKKKSRSRSKSKERRSKRSPTPKTRKDRSRSHSREKKKKARRSRSRSAHRSGKSSKTSSSSKRKDETRSKDKKDRSPKKERSPKRDKSPKSEGKKEAKVKKEHQSGEDKTDRPKKPIEEPVEVPVVKPEQIEMEVQETAVKEEEINNENSNEDRREAEEVVQEKTMVEAKKEDVELPVDRESVSPKREKPKKTSKSRSPGRSKAKSPKGKASASPHHRSSPSPRKRSKGSPSPRRKGLSPSPAGRSRHRSRSKTPSRKSKHTRRSRSITPPKGSKRRRGHSWSVSPYRRRSPVPRISRSRSHSRSRSRHKHRSPVRHRSRSPKRSPSWGVASRRRRTPSPRGRSPRMRSRSPRPRSRTPRGGRRSRTPVKKRSRSPKRESTKHKKKKSDRDRSRDKEARSKEKKKKRRNEDEDDGWEEKKRVSVSPDKSGAEAKVVRNYDEEEKGYDSTDSEKIAKRNIALESESSSISSHREDDDDHKSLLRGKSDSLKKTSDTESDRRSQQMDLDSD